VFAAGLLPITVLHAQSISTQIMPFFTEAGNSTVNFVEFDPSLGTLTGVSLNFTATESYVMGAYQTGGSGDNSYSYQIGSSEITVAGTDFTLGASSTLTGVSPGTTTYTTTYINTTIIPTAYSVFAAGGVPSFPGGVMLVGTTGPITGSVSLPLDFSSSPALAYTFTPGSTTVGATGGNNDWATMVGISGTATLTYDYTPIPEPATYAALLGVAAFGLVIRRRKLLA